MPDLIADIHTLHIYQAVHCFYHNDFASAIVEYDQALSIRESSYARLGRAITLLCMGRYPEGFKDYPARWRLFRDEMTERGRRFYDRNAHWQGEPGQRVIILHEAGYGDTVQLLRYVPIVEAMSAAVTLDMPAPLEHLACQLAPMATDDDDGMVATTFELMSILRQTTETVPAPPYLMPDAVRRAEWARKIGNGGKRKIGIAWTTKLDEANEHPNQRRSIPLESLLAKIPGCQPFSLQTQEAEKARALGVRVLDLRDFADVAAIASLMDDIVSIDTAALHVAGAIGHPNIHALLPYAATWRWLHGNWYPNMTKQKLDSEMKL
jgi:hypothetical protein